MDVLAEGQGSDDAASIVYRNNIIGDVETGCRDVQQVDKVMRMNAGSAVPSGTTGDRLSVTAPPAPPAPPMIRPALMNPSPYEPGSTTPVSPAPPVPFASFLPVMVPWFELRACACEYPVSDMEARWYGRVVKAAARRTGAFRSVIEVL
jgi:hypothetical protein